MRHTFSNIERLKQKKHLDLLFEQGEAINEYPLRIVYCPMVFEDGSPMKVGVSVSKRIFKNAVDRNRIKRLAREYFRCLPADNPTLDVVLLARRGLDGLENSEVSTILQQLWIKLRNNVSDNNASQN